MIRDAKIEDFNKVYLLHEMLVKKLVKIKPGRFALKDNEKKDFQERFKKYIGEDKRKLIVYELNEEVIGFGACKILKSVNFSKFEEHGEITEISVRGDMQNKGIGGEIMKEMESFLRGAGIREIMFLVEVGNMQSMRAWEKIEYEKGLFVYQKILD